MRSWGLCFGPAWQTSIADLIGPARSAEQAGFDRLAIGEFRSDALTWLGVLAGATSRVPIATTIASIALRHPTVVAESVAALADVFEGRVELGLGVSHPGQVTGDLGLEQPGLGDLEEYTNAVRSVLAGRPFEGRRFRAPAHERRRVSSPTVPILVSVLGEQAARRAAGYADGVILTWSPHEWTRRIADVVADRDASTGRSTSVWVVVPTLPGDLDTARVACARHLRQYLKLDSYHRMLSRAAGSERIERAGDASLSDREVADALGASLLDSLAALGSRDRVTAAIDGATEAGADEVLLYPLDTGSGWHASLDATIVGLAP